MNITHDFKRIVTALVETGSRINFDATERSVIYIVGTKGQFVLEYRYHNGAGELVWEGIDPHTRCKNGDVQRVEIHAGTKRSRFVRNKLLGN